MFNNIVNNECRICKSDDNQKNLIFPCKCKGSVKYVHRNCLNLWINNSSNYKSKKNCEICKYKYKFINKNKRFIYLMIIDITNFTCISLLCFLCIGLGFNTYEDKFILFIYNCCRDGFYYFTLFFGIIAWFFVLFNLDAPGSIRVPSNIQNNLFILIPGIIITCLLFKNFYNLIYEKNILIAYETEEIINYKE